MADPTHVATTPPMASGVLTRHAAAHLAAEGVDPAPLLETAAIPLSILDDPDERVVARDQILFLNAAAEAVGDDLLGFHLALTFDSRALGLPHYLLVSARTLGDALACGMACSASVNEAVRLQDGKTEGASLELAYPGVERDLDRHQAEFWLTCILRQCRALTNRELVPSSAVLVHVRPGRVPEIDRFFGLEVAFGAERDLLEFKRDAADLPIATHDPYLHALLTKLLGPASAARDAQDQVSLRLRVENAIKPRLRHGTATIDAVAKDLGTSARTLTRKLAEDNTSFSAVLDDVRFRLAVQYLRDGTPTISQVAWLLGYREPSTSVRAFKRWTGQTPSEFRRQLQRRSASDR